MSNKMPNGKKFDLEERTALFGESTIEFCKSIPRGPLMDPLINQVMRAGTSVGANYCEADCAETRKDFEHKIGICKKEAKESKHWFRMIAKAYPKSKDEARYLWKEANELNLIFTAIVKKSRLKQE